MAGNACLSGTHWRTAQHSTAHCSSLPWCPDALTTPFCQQGDCPLASPLEQHTLIQKAWRQSSHHHRVHAGLANNLREELRLNRWCLHGGKKKWPLRIQIGFLYGRWRLVIPNSRTLFWAWQKGFWIIQKRWFLDDAIFLLLDLGPKELHRVLLKSLKKGYIWFSYHNIVYFCMVELLRFISGLRFAFVLLCYTAPGWQKRIHIWEGMNK